jgi:antibiotic biosynthesis monooxygenase (ABM) superfamily enzyme
LVQSDPEIQKLTGLEFWFTPPYFKKSSDLTSVISPPRYKMVIVTIPVISLLLLTLVPQIHFVTEMLFIPYSIKVSHINDLFDNAHFN